jgi:branched-chain amino acid transport system ATP-binding protein
MLKIEGINKHFGGVQAVKDLSFKVEENKITSIIGPNGAGKTTVFNLLTGIFGIDSGKIFFENHDISRLKTHKIAKLGIARTFQNLQIFSNMSVLENIMTGMHQKCKTNVLQAAFSTERNSEKKIREESLKILEILELKEYSDLDAGSLPFGIQRQIEISRAIAFSPSIILMDEPAAGLNPQETDDLAGKIKKILSLGITILLIEHDMNLVMKISDNIIVLNFGEKIAEGKPQDIQKNNVVINAYLGE